MKKKRSQTTKIASSAGISLSIGFILTIISSWLFFGMLIGVVFTQQVNTLDIGISNFLNRFRTPQLTSFFWDFTNVGSWGIAIIGVIITVVCLFYHKWFLSTLWASSIVGGYALNIVIKSLVQRPRPIDALIPGYSFPSGHAMVSTVAYGMLSYYILLFIKNQFNRIAMVCFFIGLIMLIGFSRIFLDVHYFSDVIGGYGAGAVWLLFCIYTLNKYYNRRREASEYTH